MTKKGLGPQATPKVPARWEAPGKIENLPEPAEASAHHALTEEAAREQAAAAEAGAIRTPPAISEVEAKAEAEMVADRGIFHAGGHRTARRGGH